MIVKKFGRLKNLEEFAKVLDELGEGEEAVIEGIDYVEVVSDEKPKHRVVQKN